jgi:predicted nuclease of predicted toxin-antitoxin system
MKLKLLVDMNLSPAWIEPLREAGYTAVHWSKIGSTTASDEELFHWARQNKHIVFTHDLDFGAMLAATGAEAPSVFQIRTDDVSPEALSERAISLLHRMQAELATGALVVVDERRERIRILPLREAL